MVTTIPDRVWAVTTIQRDFDLDLSRVRTPGIFPSEETALQAVLNNYGDIYEAGYYPYAVVEPVSFGLYPIDRDERQWFEWIGDRETGGYVKRDEEPEAISEFQRININISHWHSIG